MTGLLVVLIMMAAFAGIIFAMGFSIGQAQAVIEIERRERSGERKA